MPVSQPNPVSILSPQQSSAGSVKEQANQVRYSGGNTQTPDLWAKVSSALASIQSQIDTIVNALRTPQGQAQLTQVADSKGNPQVLLGDMTGQDNRAFSGLWVFQLAIGGKGPGDPNGAVIGVGTGGIIVLSGDLSIANLQASGAIQAFGNISSTGGKVTALGNVESGAQVKGTSALITGTVEANTLNLDQGIPGGYQFASVKVVGGRQTGWALPTGTISRATFDQSTVTLPQLAQRLAALIDDLSTHGLIGP